MADIDTSTWSETAASNNAATPNGYPEAMAYSAVNDCARETMAAVKREWNRSHPTLATAGTATALTLTYTTAPAAYVQGLEFAFRANQDVGAAATLNVNTLGAKTIKRASVSGLSSLATNDIRSGQLVVVAYDSSADAMVIIGGDNGKVGMRHFTTLSITSTTNYIVSLPSGVSNFRIIGTNVATDTAGTHLSMQLSTDGSTFLGTDYLNELLHTSGAGVSSTSLAAQAAIYLFYDAGTNALNRPCFDGTLYVGSAGDYSRWNGTGSGQKNNGGSAAFALEQLSGRVSFVGTTVAVKITWAGGAFTAGGSISFFSLSEGV